jgi:hypothetical protein
MVACLLQAAHPRRGVADCGEHRQAAGIPAARAVAISALIAREPLVDRFSRMTMLEFDLHLPPHKPEIRSRPHGRQWVGLIGTILLGRTSDQPTPLRRQGKANGWYSPSS